MIYGRHTCQGSRYRYRRRTAVRKLDRLCRAGPCLAAITLVLIIIVGLDAIAAFIDEVADNISATYTFGEVSALHTVGLTLPGQVV